MSRTNKKRFMQDVEDILYRKYGNKIRANKKRAVQDIEDGIARIKQLKNFRINFSRIKQDIEDAI